MDEIKVDQVKTLFEEAFCSGCEEYAECYKCDVGKSKENFYTMMENIALVNDIDKTLNKEVDSE